MISAAEFADVNCLGSPQVGNVSRRWYSGVAKSDESVGLCCEDGKTPVRSLFGSWSCVQSEPSDPGIVYACDYYYNSQFAQWIASVGVSSDPKWCVAPADGRACCSVIHFASAEYWDDAATGNVKVY